MPTSDKQLAANRANAAKSTGPRTPEGKTRSSQNARTHGFTASTFAVVRLEELDEVARLKHDLLAVYQPVNSQELFAIELIALAQQTRFRAARLESGVFINCLDMALNDNGTPFSPMTPALVGDGDIEITRAQNRNYALADGFCRMAKQNNSFSLFLRYKAQAELQYRRAVEELNRLRALRPELPKEAILETQPEENEPASTPPDEPVSDPQPSVSGEAPSVSEGAPSPTDVPEGASEKRGADDLVVCAHPVRARHPEPLAPSPANPRRCGFRSARWPTARRANKLPLCPRTETSIGSPISGNGRIDLSNRPCRRTALTLVRL
jgi:hypothetical protein